MNGGQRDPSDPVRDASVVVVNGGGSGVLVSPRLVLTAAHVVPDRLRPQFPRRDAWNALNSQLTVQFGRQRSRPALTVRAREYNPAGAVDMALIRLDTPVPPDIAVPTRVMTTIPQGATPGDG